MKKLFYCCFFMVLAVFLHAQTADRIEGFLNAKAISYGDAALLVLEAADAADRFGSGVISSKEEAFRFAAGQKWLPADATSNTTATLEWVSLLTMQSFGLKGGIFYSLSKQPHYAYRELAYKDIIQGRIDPQMPVSGEILLFMVGRVLDEIEENS